MIAAPYQIAHGESAKVSGGSACSGGKVGITLDIDGEIDGTTVESVRKLFAEYHERLDRVRAGLRCNDNTDGGYSIYGNHYGINSPGGSVDAAMAIGRMLRKERAWILIPDRSVCASACVLVLAGAVDRHIAGAKVAIHRPYFETTPQKIMPSDKVRDTYQTMMAGIRAYLREMNVSERLANDMLAIEPENARLLTDAELKGYGLLGIDTGERQTQAGEQEARDISAANRRGLDRREYIRRKALVTGVCGARFGDVEWRAEHEPCAKLILETGQSDFQNSRRMDQPNTCAEDFRIKVQNGDLPPNADRKSYVDWCLNQR